MTTLLTRRSLLASGAAALAMGQSSVAFARGVGEKRFVFIMLRGGMDGLAAVPPVGDPDFSTQRGPMAISRALGARPLSGGFALHPAMPEAHALFQARELLVVHAIAPPHRTRSHFDAQNVLEGGGVRAFERRDGWLNRALLGLGGEASDLGFAIAQNMPLAMRGPAKVSSWAPRRITELPELLTDRIADMYANDPILSAAFASGLSARDMAAQSNGGMMGGAKGVRPLVLAANAALAAEFLSRPNGPRIAMLEGGQWDTHAGQGLAQGKLARLLADLSVALAALKTGLGPAWRETVVVAATEFGRTVRPNGARDTDHGFGGAAFVAGGAVTGGQVIADWPGLSNAALFDGRDLAATTDMRSLFKAVLSDHLGVTDRHLNASVFPGSQNARALANVIRS